MPSSNGHHEYDANLLASAPAPTKGMLQSGYATDLLVDKPKPSRRDDLESGRHKSISKHTSIPNSGRATSDNVEPKVLSATSIPTKPSPSTEKPPFYRTKKGIIILVIVAIVILAAIIGGAVGATTKNVAFSPTSRSTVSVFTGVSSTSSSVSAAGLTPSSTAQVTGADGSPVTTSQERGQPSVSSTSPFPAIVPSGL